MKPFHKKVKMPHADSVTKNTNVMTMLCRMYSLYTSKIQVIKKVIDNYIQWKLSLDLISLLNTLPLFSGETCSF